ncbi:MAG TPA: carbohydrate-binding family 9-like protein [Terriglobales bacterium]|nr:carbohydrate-binding family 9-like protein [Terriglobales bacterium]
MASTTPSPYTADLSLDSHHIARDFAPDGDLSKPVWQHATRATFEHNYTGEKTYPELKTEVASLWSDHYVYFAFWCKYRHISTYQGEDPARERWELWERDVVEVFLNPQPERVKHYYEFEVAPNNQWLDLEIDLDKKPFNDAGWNSGFEHAVRIDRQHQEWMCEIRIPLRALQTHLTAGSEWRGNFYRAEGTGLDEQRWLMAWSTVVARAQAFHNPSRFGIIRFRAKH